MTDRPILFSAPMICALLAGTKTQTRRVIPEAMQEAYGNYDDWCSNVSAGVPTSRQWEREFYLERIRIRPGDRLWVRERTHIDGSDVNYAADLSCDPAGLGYRPSIHMPRWASRLTLYVTDVRVERLQDISEKDAEAEGVCVGLHDFDCVGGHFPDPAGYCVNGCGGRSYSEVYRRLWDSINGTGSWDANPFVAAYTFAVRHGNIDTLPATLEEAA